MLIDMSAAIMRENGVEVEIVRLLILRPASTATYPGTTQP